MTGLITKAAVLSACGMLLAVAAFAGVPTAAQSTSPAFLNLAGSKAGVPDSTSSKITITVNDVAHNPIAGSNVVVDFSACGSDIKMAANQLNPNYTVVCTASAKTVSAYTNASGVVNFTLLGGSVSPGVPITTACGRIYADGVLLSSPGVGAFDLNGVGGLTAADLSSLLTDIGTNPTRKRGDYNGVGGLTAADLSLWLGALGRTNSTVSGAICAL